MILEELIQKGKKIYATDVTPSTYGFKLGINYKTWMNDCLNFIGERFPEHRAIDAFEEYKRQAETGWSDKFDDMIAVLNSLQNFETMSNENDYVIEDNKSFKRSVLISHSSLDSGYGDAVLQLLISLGVPHEDIFYSSKQEYGIDCGEDILNVIKEKIDQNPIIILLLSNNYYKSSYCLCELGACWIKGLKLYPLILPKMDIDKVYRGAISPLKKGNRITEKKEVENFIKIILDTFNPKVDFRYINEALEKFHNEIKLYEEDKKNIFITCSSTNYIKKNKLIDIKSSRNAYPKFIKICEENKDEDIEYIAVLENMPNNNKKLLIQNYFEIKRVKFSSFEIIGEIKTLTNPIILDIEEVKKGKEVKNEKLFSYRELISNNIY